MTKKQEYNKIYSEFIGIKKYTDMRKDIHHGLTRLEHINRVAKWSFYVSKLLKLDYISTTRGALLHDFFTNEDIDKEQYKEYLKKHSQVALENAKKYFDLNKKEEDIIIKHMYPLTKAKPSFKESYTVSAIDKVAGVYEFFRYELKMQCSIFILFLINIW